MSSEGRIEKSKKGSTPASGAASRIARAAMDMLLPSDPPPLLNDDQRANLEIAEAFIRVRDLRERLLGNEVAFADPAWDILLDLYVGSLRGRVIAVGDACIGARVPTTTALRWIDQLAKKGAVERVSDPRDRRRTLVRISGRQMRLMDEFFRNVSSSTSLGDASSKRSSSRPSGR